MTKQFRVSTTLPRKLQELGLSPEAVLRRAGLPMGLFKMDKILVSTEEFFALHRGIAEASNDQGLGLKLGTEERLERYDPVKIAAISARSFRDAIQRVSRYKQLTCPEEIRVVERGNESAVQFVWLLAHEKEPPLLVDVCFAWIVSMGQSGYWATSDSQAGRVSTASSPPRDLRNAFSMSSQVQGRSERIGIQQGRYGTTVRHA